MKRTLLLALLLLTALPAGGQPTTPRPSASPPSGTPQRRPSARASIPRAAYRTTEALLRTGRTVFQDRCADCHGAEGRGDGPNARYLLPPPRDLTRAVFSLRSTPTGALPTAADLVRTIRRGIAGTAMPAWSGLDERTLWALAAFVQTLSPRFALEPGARPILVPPAPPPSEQSIARGRRVYRRMGCAECHGRDGRGDGPSAQELRDDLGNRVYPFDFTRSWKMKAGTSAEDLYRTLHTGMDGTAMPSYDDSLTPQDTWDLVHYTRSLTVN